MKIELILINFADTNREQKKHEKIEKNKKKHKFWTKTKYKYTR